MIAALVNGVFGFLTAWVFTRYEFPGRRVIDAFVDFPFALPTAVAGIALTELYAPHGWIGSWFARFGIKIAYTPLGVVVALIFIGFPFVVRTVQPVIARKARAGGRGRNRRVPRQLRACKAFRSVILPAGASIATHRHHPAPSGAQSVNTAPSFSSPRNLPFKTEITPVLIVSKLERIRLPGRSRTIGVVMLIMSLAILLLVNIIQWWSGRRTGTF